MNGLPRRLGRLLLAASIALLAFGAPASATFRREAPEAPVRLLAPAEGTELRAGALATLEWAPLGSLVRPGGWEEWEAFLSLDGGATYTVRLTPHLDRGLRRITFRVPDLPTRNGRLLLRVGDERQERAFELPARLIIERPAAPAGLPVESALDLTRAVRRQGEPARPGEPGVRLWVEGSRDGSGLSEVAAAEPAAALPGTPFLHPGGSRMPAMAATAAPPSGAPAADPGSPTSLPSPQRTFASLSRTPLPAPADILLLIQRQNE